MLGGLLMRGDSIFFAYLSQVFLNSVKGFVRRCADETVLRKAPFLRQRLQARKCERLFSVGEQRVQGEDGSGGQCRDIGDVPWLCIAVSRNL